MATRSTGRPKPVAVKAGLSMNPKRRYGCGGKMKTNSYKCGGKIKK